MELATISPDDIAEKDGQIVGTWQTVVESNSARKIGEKTYATERVIIPESFRGVVNQAKTQKRSVRVHYEAIFGNQTAHVVETI